MGVRDRWPATVLAATLSLMGCTGSSRSLDSGWFGKPPGAASASVSPRDSARDAATVETASRPAERLATSDAAPRVTLGGTTHAGTLALKPARTRPTRRGPVAPPGDLKASLLRLRSLQSNLFALGRTYADHPDQLGYAPDAGVDVSILWASNWGWAAVARDDDHPDRACTMYVGTVPHEGAAAGRIDDAKPGVPNCTPTGETSGRWVAYPQLLQPDSARTSLARGAATMMRRDLAKLVLSQRSHRAMQGSYARRIDPMSLHYAWHPGVALRVLSADVQGWSAEATYDQWPDHSCVIWAGAVSSKPATAASRKVPESEGVPECDD